jgi:hypothetical protein
MGRGDAQVEVTSENNNADVEINILNEQHTLSTTQEALELYTYDTSQRCLGSYPC